ncbi:MAG: chaperone NapD [Magnetococcales bacterium]|nr:chaperone NapD [Magnetococcales bacterium]NGZ27693.1 chaperone NapD [Magnetococcales bacterium]
MPHEASSFALASAILQVRPDCIHRVQEQVVLEEGVEVHGMDPRGCLIITLEGAAGDPLTERLYRLRDLEGVLAADLVYQHIEDDASAPHHKETAP